MIIEISKKDLALLYSKAKEGYTECVNNKENDFLREEADVPLESIQLKEANIKIVFSRDDADMYLFEVCLTLHVDNRTIGKYVYMENKIGEAIDDSLVFY